MKFSTEKQNLSVPKDNSYGHLHNFESFQNIFSSKFCLVQFIRVKGIHVGIFWFQNKNSYTRNLASAIYLFSIYDQEGIDGFVGGYTTPGQSGYSGDNFCFKKARFMYQTAKIYYAVLLRKSAITL